MRLFFQLAGILGIIVIMVGCGQDKRRQPSQTGVYGTPTPIPQPTVAVPTSITADILLNNFVRADGAIRLSYPVDWLIESTGEAGQGQVIIANTRAALRGRFADDDAYRLTITWGVASDYGAVPDVLNFNLNAVLQENYPQARDPQSVQFGSYRALQASLPETTINTEVAVVDLGGGVVALAQAENTNPAYDDLMGQIIASIIYDGPRPIDSATDFYPITYTLQHEDATLIYGVSFVGRSMLSWDFNGRVYLWDLDSGTADFVLPHEGRIIRTHILSDAVLVLAEGQPIFLYDLLQGSLLHQFVVDFGRIVDMVVSPDGQMIAAILVNNQIWSVRIWEIDSGALVATLRPTSGDTVDGVVWDHASTRLALYGSGTQARVYDVLESERVLIVEHTSPILGVAWSPDDTLLASYGRDNVVHIWATSDNELRQSLNHSHAPIGVQFSADGASLLSWQSDRFATVWDVKSGMPRFRFETFPSLGGAFFIADEQQIISWASPNASTQEVHVVSAQNGETILRLSDSGFSGPSGYQAERRWLVVTHLDKTGAALYTLNDGDLLARFEHNDIEGAVIHPQLPLVVTYGRSGDIQVYSLSEIDISSDKE